MKSVTMTICLTAAILFITAGSAWAVVEYNDGGTHYISSVVDDEVWVDYQSPGVQTTVNLLSGGSLGGGYHVYGHTDSRLNLAGGTVAGYLHSRDSSYVTISGAYVDGYALARETGHLTMAAGYVYGYLLAYDSSQVEMSGGVVKDYLCAYSNSQFTISDGVAGGGLYACDWSEVTMSGGTVVLDIRLDHNAILVLDGSDFAIDGVPVGLAEITSILRGSCSDEPIRRLTGTLANGDMLNNQFQVGGDARIVLVPEPATLLLLCSGLCLVRRFRKYRYSRQPRGA